MTGGVHVVNDDVFRAVLVGRRKRAHRGNRPVLLVLVSVDDRRATRSAPFWAEVIGALTAVKRDTDVLGWLEWQSVLGVIFSDVSGADVPSARAAAAAAVRSELAKRVDAATLAGLRIRVHVHPGPDVADTAGDIGPLLDPELQRSRVATRAADGAKRALDITLSGLFLVLLSPLLAVIALLVKGGSPGPALFGQIRIGHMMKPFRMLKFRTMHLGADPRLHREFVSSFIAGNGQPAVPASEAPFKLADDPRVTPVGRWLRRTSLDELPQLWNVLRGEMSLVGPRPPLAYELELYKPWHRRRVLEAKPGITGLWQVAGRSRTTFDEMVRLDLRYVQVRSLWTDIKILLATPAAVISRKGAR